MQYVQQMNRKLVLDTLLQYAPLSRVDIARRTTLSPSTVTNAVTVLMEEGLVEEIGTGFSTAVGRRPILLDVCWDSRCVIGLSVMDYQLFGAVTNLQAEVQSTYSCEIANDTDILDVLKDAIDELLRDVKSSIVIGIGVSVSGIVNRETGRIEHSTNFKWDNPDLGKSLREHTGIPIILENDTNAAALGEHFFGIGRGAQSFAYVYVGTGVGSGIVIDRRLVLGTWGNAGEIGHMTIDWNGQRCRCGGRGCLESYISWGAIKSIVLQDNPHADISARERPRAIQLAYESEHVRDQLNERARMLGTGVASLSKVIDPEVIIVDGIYRDCPAFMEVMREEAESRLINVTDHVPQITSGTLGAQAAVFGCVALVLEHNGYLSAVQRSRVESGESVESVESVDSMEVGS